MKVLVVDDDAVYRSVMKAMIRASGHECLVARDGLAGLAILQEENVEVLITDREMPGIDGLELCRLVRSELSTEHVYIILVTGLGSSEQAREGMLAGADDYLVKPSQLVDVQLRLIAAERVSTLHRKLELANQELRAVARRDPLTNLGNRRSLSEDLSVMTDRLHRYGQRFTLALLDVDHFKLYNDTFGHPAGDEALKAVAGVLTATSRTGDMCYRYGGEEFLCVFPEQSAVRASNAIQRVVDGIAALAIPHAEGAGSPFLTVSVGIAEMVVEYSDADDAVQAADAALYQAKKQGRNRVEVAPLQPSQRMGAVPPGPAQRAVLAEGGERTDRTDRDHGNHGERDDRRGAADDGGVTGELLRTTAMSLVPDLPDVPVRTAPAVDLTVLDALLEQLDDQDGELRDDLLASYLDNGSEQVRSLVAAAAASDTSRFAATAHMMRSSSALLGATVLAGLCHQADDMARTGAADLTEIAELIRVEYDSVAEAMAQLAGTPTVLPRQREALQDLPIS